MGFKDMKISLNYLMEEDYREFLKALISIESGVDHELSLDTVVDNFMETDKTTFMIEELVEPLEKELDLEL